MNVAVLLCVFPWYLLKRNESFDVLFTYNSIKLFRRITCFIRQMEFLELFVICAVGTWRLQNYDGSNILLVGYIIICDHIIFLLYWLIDIWGVCFDTWVVLDLMIFAAVVKLLKDPICLSL